MDDAEKRAAGLKQIDIEALWLLARVDLSAFDPELRGARGQAQLRLQRLADIGVITMSLRERPRLAILERNDHEQ